MHKNAVRLILGPVALLAGASFFASIASATVVGTLVTGTSGTVTVTLSSAFFNTDPAAIGGGNSDVTNGTSLGFAGCTFTGSPNTGTAGCLPTQDGITINNADLTTTAPSQANANTFLTFAGFPNLVFSETGIGPGSSNTNCATVTSASSGPCSVFAGSPIVISFFPGGSLVSLAVTGKASDIGTGGLAAGSNYNGAFSEVLSQLLPNGQAPTPENLQNFFCTGAPSVNGGANTCTGADFTANRSLTVPDVAGSFTATAAPATPEPNTWALMLIGGGLIGVTRIRRRRA